MALVAPVKNGQVVDTTSATSAEETKKSNSSLDKQAFLQLLVAQMKYQDPLEPTSNTEYISQLATFSSLEEMQNMRSVMEMQRASSLVGQQVFVKSTNADTGETSLKQGQVDYVTFQNGKTYVSVNGETYPLDDVDSVYDGAYWDAYNMALEWTIALNKLPSINKLDLSNEEDVMKLKETYDSMTSYQKTFLTNDNKEKLENYVARIELLKKNQEEQNNKTDETGKTDDSGNDDETGKTGGSGKTEETGKTDENGKTDGTDNADKIDGTGGKAEESDPAEESGGTDESGGTGETDEA